MDNDEDPDINGFIGSAEEMSHLNKNPNAGVEESLNHREMVYSIYAKQGNYF